ncbi:MAG TPA: hypothetical protein VFA26_16780 [Gemmataceae bacterium]|nr:hypothetical protein [Gemmataceae bacterium]
MTWHPVAENRLADLWSAGPDRQAIADAADTIDMLLARDPLNQGESRTEKHRIMIVPPLAAHFEVSEDDRIVHVLEVWRVKG